MKKFLTVLAAASILSTSASANECAVFGENFLSSGSFTLKSGYTHTMCFLKGSKPTESMVRKSPEGNVELYGLINITDHSTHSPTQFMAKSFNPDNLFMISITFVSLEILSDKQIKLTLEFKTKEGGAEQVSDIIGQ